MSTYPNLLQLTFRLPRKPTANPTSVQFSAIMGQSRRMIAIELNATN